MFVRIRDRLVNLDHVAEVDLHHKPFHGGGPGVQLVMAVSSETINATGAEAEGLRELFASLEEYFGHLDGLPVHPLTVLSFDPTPLSGRDML